MAESKQDASRAAPRLPLQQAHGLSGAGYGCPRHHWGRLFRFRAPGPAARTAYPRVWLLAWVAVVSVGLLFPVAAAASAASGSKGRAPPPSKESLRSKSMSELKAILRHKGAKCKKCVEKDDLVDRVIETWDWLPKEASSPDGQIRMTKEQFIKNLQSSMKKSTRTQNSDGHELDDGGDDDSEDDSDTAGVLEAMMPNFDEIWADFSEKLSKGEIQTDDNGRLMYQVQDQFGGEPPGMWEKYKTHVMVGVNVVLLYYMQHIRRKERAQREAARANEAAAGRSDGEIKDKKA